MTCEYLDLCGENTSSTSSTSSTSTTEYGLALFEERFQKMEADIKAHGGWNVQLSKGGSHDQKKVWNPPEEARWPGRSVLLEGSSRVFGVV